MGSDPRDREMVTDKELVQRSDYNPIFGLGLSSDQATIGTSSRVTDTRLKFTQPDRKSDGQTDRKTDRQKTDRQKVSQDIQKNIKKVRKSEKQGR